MNEISIAGLNLYLYGFLQFKSKISLIIFCNGILYHNNSDNIVLRYYDTVCNIIFTLFVTFHAPKSRSFALFSIFSYICNFNFFKHQLIHVYFVQFPLFFGLLKYQNIICIQ